MERLKEMQLSSRVQVDKVHDSEDPNANGQGDVWVISAYLHKDADALYLCTGGYI